MPDSKKPDVRAPKTSVFKGGSGGQVSFEVYFLRDLFSKGKIDAALIREIVKQNALDESKIDEALKHLKDPAGNAVPRGIADFLSEVAAVVGGNN